MDFMKELLRQCEDAETPRPWIRWAGLSAISAVTSFNVHLDKFYYKLSPNVFSLLIGKSGLGKGLPVWIAKTLAEEVDNTRVIAGRNSIESVIQELSRTKTKENGKMITDSRGFFVSGEFANFVISNPQALTILTEWYDTHYLGTWSNTLKHGGAEKLKNLSVTIFGACSPPHFKDVVSQRDIEGGFVGRTMIVHAEKRYKFNALVDKPDVELDLSKLSDYMKQLSTISKGEFKWSEDGKRMYRDWYMKVRAKEEKNGMSDNTGTDQRIQDHVCKVAMLTSLARDLELILREQDIKEAIDICTQFSQDVRRVTLGEGGKNELSQQTGLILNYLLKQKNNRATREEILSKFWNDIDAFDMDRIETTLGQAGAMETESEGSDKYYKLTEKYLDQLEEFRKKKEKKR